MGQLLPRPGHRLGSRQLGRRAIVTYAAIVVRPNSPVFTPQQLANKQVGVPFYFGTHYLALHMLEVSCRANRSRCAACRTARAIASTC